MSDLTHVERLPLTRLSMLPGFLYPDGSPRVIAYSIYGTLFFGPSTQARPCSTQRWRIGSGDPRTASSGELDTTALEGLESLCKTSNQGCALIRAISTSSPPR